MRQLVAVLVLLFVASPADAQFRRDKRFAERGDLALMASFNGLDLTQLRPSFDGIGLRYRAGDQTVLGAAVGFYVSSNESERGLQNTDEQRRDRVDTSESDGGRVSVWFEQHVGRRNRTVSPFVGVGLQGFRARNTFESAEVSTCSDPNACSGEEQLRSQERVTQGVTAGVFLGAEVRVVRGVTLGGAYGLGASYSTYEEETVLDPDGTTPVGSTQEGDRYGVGTQASKLYLSVYF